MDHFSTRIHTASKALTKTGLAVYFNELEHQNLLFTFRPFLGLVTKLCSLRLEVSILQHYLIGIVGAVFEHDLGKYI